METSDKRVYLLACNRDDTLFVIGVYTNKKVLLETMNLIGIEDCYIKAKTKNVAVTAGSLHSHFSDRITIYKKDENGNETYKFKAVELKLNKVNHIISRYFPEITEDLIG